jgi:tRNA(Ile)-lysidine synthase
VTLFERVLTTVRRHDLIPPGARVLAAVSGGADSVALACVLARLAPELGFTLAGLAHLNHALRGSDSDVDEIFTGNLALKLDVPFVTRRVDVGAEAEASRESLEAAARRVRYAFLDAAATGLAADLIATGHTADDQAETLLMRLMRGAGLHGLSGVRPRNGRVVRPLLDARRADVVAFLEEAGESWREDASNADTALTRNRVRHIAIPALKSAGGDGVIDALARTASLIQDDADELERLAIEKARSIVLSNGTLDCEALDAAGPAIARRVIRRALEAAAGGRFLSLEHVEGVRSLIKEDAALAIQLPGVRAAREGRAIRIEPGGESVPPREFETALEVPGTVEVPGVDLVISAEVGRIDRAGVTELNARAEAVAVQGVETARLTVRNRRPGDALRPLGAPGRRKVQDVFVDRKTARIDRDRVPLVVDDRGRIIWVVGHTIAEEFRVTTPEASVLLLKVRRKGAGAP